MVKTNNSMSETPQQQINARLKALLAPQAALLKIALLCAALSAVFFVLQSWLLAHLFAGWLHQYLDDASRISTQSLLAVLPWLILCFAVRPLLQYVRERLSQTASLRVRHQLRQQLLGKLAAAGPARQQLGSDGALGSQVLEQVDALDGYISRYYVQRYLVVISPVILLIATAWYSWLAAALLLITAPMVPLFMIMLGNAAAQANRNQFAALARLSGRFLDFIRGMTTLQQVNATALAEGSIADASQQYRERTMKVLQMAFLSTAVLEFFTALAIALVALYLGLGLVGQLPWSVDVIPVPYMGALFILLLAPEFYAPLRQLGSDYHAKAQAEGAVAELQPLLNTEFWQHPGHQSIHLVAPPAVDIHQLSVHAADGRLRLADFSLHLAPGERVLIQGPSGSGKSTLLDTLLGFADYQGSIGINNEELRQLSRDDWHQQIGYLAQQASIQRGTIADNLRLAAPDADDAALITVLQQVELWPLIEQLPLQLQTPLGERGKGLSGGQLQRLSLAQLLLRDAPLWLLDEPTEHLDPDTASRLHQLLEAVSRGKTLLLISHQQDIHWLDRCVHIQPAAPAEASV